MLGMRDLERLNSDQAKDRSAGGEGVEDGGESEVRIEDSEEEINDYLTEEGRADHLAADAVIKALRL